MNTNISSTDILDITILKRNQKRHNTIKYHLTFIAILCVLLFILAGELMGDVSIKVKERDGVTRSAEPVTMGIPFAKGELQSSTPVRITNGSGNTVDAQFMTMATWGDGSIKWLKCDFQAGVSANATATYTLKTGTSHNPSTELTVSESSGAITVTTGPLRFMVNKNAFNVLHRVYLDLDNNRQYTSGEEIITPGQSVGPIVTKGSADYKATANTPENIEIEEQGPMKVVIKVSGRHYRNSSYLLKYETRIYAYAGKPYIKLWHVYANGKTVDSLGDSMNPANGASFDRYALDFKLNLTGSKTARFGGQGGNVVTVNLGSGQKATLLQKDRVGTGQALSYSIKQGNSQVSSGSKAPGWGSLIDSTWGMTVASRYFWQKYPKGLAFGDDGTVSVEPAPTPEYLYVGMGTGDEILLVFHSAGDAPGASFISASPLLPRASAQQYQDSQAFYNLRSGQPPYTQMNNYIDDVTDNHLQNVSGLGVYGNINFGDTPVDYWYFDDTEVDATAWGNNYYDCNVLTPIRLFVQEGDLRYSDIFIPGARFFMETACWNPYDTTDWLAGYSPGYSGYHRSSTHFEQHYAEGIWYYYYLTGDERAREIGLRGAKAIKDEQWWGNLNVNCRMAYQRGSSVLETWKNTRNPAYLAHAKHLLVTRILDTQDQYGLIGNIDENDNIGGEQTFMMGLYSDTLWKYIKELAPNSAERQDLGARLAKIADCIDTYARKAPGQEEYWNFFDAPNNSSPPSPYKDENDSDATLYWWGKGLVAGTYAYAYDLTGLQKYKTLAVNLLNNMWTAGVIDWGGSDFWEKPSGQVMKNILHAVAIIEGAGSPPPSNSVTVTSPNGGETLTGGVNHRVTWNWSGSISVVKIEYSLNNGGSWTSITASTGNDGAYGWVPPTTASTTCLVRISDTGGSATDTSDAVFTITTSSPGGTISLDRTILNFNGSVSNLTTGPQQVTVTASDAGIDWTVSESVSWASVSPSSGTGSGSFTVSADLSSLA
ncbi:MAG: hypothetical protein GY940_37520, partial [bacterium]|nr:hypothetical protein [bacterium]